MEGVEVGLAAEHTSGDGPQTVKTQRPDRTWKLSGTTQALQLIKDWQPDVIMQNGVEDPSIEDALLSRTPAVLFAHGYYGTCLSGRKRFSSPRLTVCHRRFGTACLALYLPRRCGGLSLATAAHRFWLQRERRSLLSRYRYILVASRAMKNEYLVNGVPLERIRIAPLFVESPSGAATEVNVKRNRRAPILMLSRLEKDKGYRQLIEACRLAQPRLDWPLKLILAGIGETADVRELAERHGVSVTLPGWVNASQRTDLLRRCAVLAVPSVWPEPFGIVGIEAASEGLPAVGFLSGGIGDWLVDGVSGMGAPGEVPSSGELADALVRALGDEARYQSLCKGAREVSARFSPDTHLRVLLRTLEDATRTRPSG